MKYKKITKTYQIPIAESGEQITQPEIIFNFLKDRVDAFSEELHLITLNTSNNIVGHHLVAKGGHNAASISPSDIFKRVLMDNCERFIISHNHPSGSSKFSEEDILFTKKLEGACEILGLYLLDHILIGDTYASYRKLGL